MIKLSLKSYSSPSCIKVAGIVIVVLLDDLNYIELIVIACKFGLIECCTVDLSVMLQDVMIGALQATVFIDGHFTFELNSLDYLFFLFLFVIL